MRLLLVNPRSRPSFWNFSLVTRHLFPQRRYTNPPLGLASIAALTPSHWQIRIIDENVEEIDWDWPADLVGVAGMTNQFGRQ
ncbi:MAG: B12-binding domain-containing radical SAM protein, partial [Candidatus Eremiobacteraeota bacterium]|nr:B12-binding domain-containing radical SAM protein [Candidatus Eremiobacteraeota bacterium]